MEKQKEIQRKEFTELSKAKIRDNRNLIISKDNMGFITIAQQLVVNENGRQTAVFLKGAIEVEIDCLWNLRWALDRAIEKLELESPVED